jgi:methyl-accepting chemotaxis protein
LKTSGLQFKVLSIVGIAMVFALSISIFSIYRVYGAIQDLGRVSREDFEGQQLILRAGVAFRQQLLEWKNVLVRGRDEDALKRHWSFFQKYETEAARLIREAHDATPNIEVRTLLEAFQAMHKDQGERYRSGFEAFQRSNFDPGEGDRAVGGVDRVASKALEDAEAKAHEVGTLSVNAVMLKNESVFRFALAANVVAVFITLAAVWIYMRRAVLAPIAVAVGFAQSIARGDLTASVRARSRDEAGQLLDALSAMSASLSKVVTEVRRASEAVATASSQVAAGTTDLSQRTEEQASSLEETAASMEELASTVRQNADNARQADELARGAARRAEQGGAEVGQVVSTMGDISTSAKRISDIIAIIDAIAFQTNILAVNAAVEAARAGDQGRGFAVVAAEVRSLAQRSAQAAREIKGLIDHSVSEVDRGTSLVEQARTTIQALVQDVRRVSELMGTISEASAEQSRGVQQVNKTVTEMDKVVQQNASAVQQSASAAAGMREQAETLVGAVSAFRLASDQATTSKRAQTPDPLSGKSQPRLVTMTALPAAAGEDWQEF